MLPLGSAFAPALTSVDKVYSSAARPVDAYSVAAFRIAFGALALIAVGRFFLNGWIDSLYIAPNFHLKYMWFDWVHPLPTLGMHLHFVLLGVLAIGITIGLFYRWCTALFCIGFLYVELLDAVTYLNHYYWLSLTSALIIFLPLHRKWSVDARRSRHDSATTIPVGVLWLLRAQLAAVYVFGGIAKMNPDWLFNAMPLTIWLNQHGDYPLIGGLLQQAWVAHAMSWSGAIFDLTIMMWMSLDRTRRFAYTILVAFHLITWQLFPSLGMFPWLMVVSTTIFFRPDWPKQTLKVTSTALASIGFDRWIPLSQSRPHSAHPKYLRIESIKTIAPRKPTILQRTAIIAVAALVVLQSVVPFRHWLYPGNVRWTEEGYRYSWRMMLSEKVGKVTFHVTDPQSGAAWTVGPDDYLSALQVERTAIDPDMILQTAHIIAADYRARGYADVEVRADVFVAFNGRQHKRLIDPEINLAAESRTVRPKGWILPER